MLEPEQDREGKRGGSLLSFADAQRAAGKEPSRLMRALAEVRAEHGARPRRPRDPGPAEQPSGQAETERNAPPWTPIDAGEEEAAAAPVRDDGEAEHEHEHEVEPFPWAASDPAQGAQKPEAAAQPADSGRAVAEEPADQADAGWKPLIDPVKVFGGVRRSKRLIVATAICGALAGVLVALGTPKKYEASAELLADPRDLNLVDKELTQSGLSNEATLAIVENQVRILTSGTVLSKVVDKLNLAADPEFNGKGTGAGLLAAVKALIAPAPGSDDPARRVAITNENLARALHVERGGKTFVILISATTQNAEKSALIANTMTDVFLDAYGDLQSNAAGRAAHELTAKLDELRGAVEAAERKVADFKAQNDIVDPQGRLITDDEIVKLNDQLSTARARTLELTARADSAKTMDVDSVVGGVMPEALSSPTIQELRAQYSLTKAEADRLDTKLGPMHPQRQGLDSQLQGLRGQITAELRRIVASTQTELRRAVQLEQELSSRLAQLKARQASLSGEMVTLRELDRDASAKRAVYEAFLLRARETGEQQGINSANMSVISKAVPPLQAKPPSRTTIALSGLLAGLLAGLGIGAARGTLDSLKDTFATESAPARRRERRRFFGRVGRADPVADPDTTHPAYSAAEPAQTGETPMPDNRNYDPYGYPPGQAQRAAYSPFAQPLAPQPPVQNFAPGPAAPQPAQAYGPPYMAYPQGAPPQPVHMQHYAPMGYPAPGAYPQAQPSPYWQPPAPPAAPAYGYQPAGPVQAGMHGQPQPYWQQPPAAMPPGYGQQPVDERAAPANHPPESAEDPIEEIRNSLRECREAIRELAESRSRRRYF